VLGDVRVRRLVRTFHDREALHAERLPRKGAERRIAVMFVDIRGFTAFAQRHLPFDVVHILNNFFTAVGERALNNNGYIDKYLGDGLLALFGLDDDREGAVCRDAVRAALGIFASLDTFNDALERDFGVRFGIGIGIHFGPAIVGAVGHPVKTEVTAIGDAVNLASRIEAQNKGLGTRLLVSSAVRRRLGGDLAVGRVVATTVPGRAGRLRLHEVLGFAAAPDPVLAAQNALDAVLARPDAFAAAFLRRADAADPAAGALFGADPREQARRATQMVYGAARALAGREDDLWNLAGLGPGHVLFGATADQHAAVNAALLDTLAEVVGEAGFPPAARTVWEQTLDRLAVLLRRRSAEA
jgi:class 3 adenylate cyclase/hemoglobin-like flavoprotein